MPESFEVTPHVFSIPAQPASYTGPQAPNVFLVHDGGEGALVDSGFGDEKSVCVRLDFLKEHADVRVKYIILTHHHFDHSSGAAQLRTATGAQVLLHPTEVPFLREWNSDAPQDLEAPAGEDATEEQRKMAEAIARFREQAAEAEPVVEMKEGDAFKVGSLEVRIVHTPGHTLGSVCIYMPAEKALFTGDTAQGMGSVAVSPPPHGDMALYLQSLERLKTLGAAVMLPGHGIAVHDVPHKLQELIDHRLEREQQILRLMAAGKRTPKAMLSAIYMELDKRILPMALRQIEAHLAKLESEGRVRRAEDEWVLV